MPVVNKSFPAHECVAVCDEDVEEFLNRFNKYEHCESHVSSMTLRKVLSFVLAFRKEFLSEKLDFTPLKDFKIFQQTATFAVPDSENDVKYCCMLHSDPNHVIKYDFHDTHFNITYRGHTFVRIDK